MNIVEKIIASEKADVRFGYVAYRDHKDTFVTKVHEFATSLKTMREYISKYGAEGGGDGPEAVTAALNEALKLAYRKNAVKIVVIIADAPPHGVTKSGDDYPNGDPNGLDPIQIARKMAEEGIILYVVACEPALSGYQFAHDFMAGLAQITQGKYLPLTSAHLLPDVIIGGAKEEISLQKLEEQVIKDSEKFKKENPTITEDELATKVAADLAVKGAKVKIGVIDDIYGSYNDSNINNMANNWNNLNDFQSKAEVFNQPEIKNYSNNDADDNNNDLNQSYNMVSKSVDKSHVQKVMKRNFNKSSKS
jgi:hypothetical protein